MATLHRAIDQDLGVLTILVESGLPVALLTQLGGSQHDTSNPHR